MISHPGLVRALAVNFRQTRSGRNGATTARNTQSTQAEQTQRAGGSCVMISEPLWPGFRQQGDNTGRSSPPQKHCAAKSLRLTSQL